MSPIDRPADPRRWRGNFLAFPGFPYAFMYPAWPKDKQAAFRTQYRAAGHTHLPLGIWGGYDGSGYQPFDFRDDAPGYRRLLYELVNAGLEPCVFVHTDAVPGRGGPWSRDALSTWARGYLPQIADVVRLWCTGWESGQIDRVWSGAWTGDGEEHLKWARTLRAILGPAAILFCHFPPERVTGWPNYPNHDGPNDEPGWWSADNPLDGLLYQRAPDEDERWVLVHTLGGRSQDGSTDIGDVERIATGAWGVHKLFVFFEHSRDLTRWARLTNAIQADGRCSGWC